MGNYDLFLKKDGSWFTKDDLLRKLIEVKAHQSDILYIHTDMSFGVPNPKFTKNDLLQIFLDVLLELKVPTLCFPTFTFSFCNQEEYSVLKSKSYMGALNEFVRKKPEAIRSKDPLMSVALLGENKDLVESIGRFSVGKDSTFDKLHSASNVKFLFLGVSAAKCFTYTHYIENCLNVPYRYDREFRGIVVDGEQKTEEKYNLFIRYKDVVPTSKNEYEQFLINNNYMLHSSCGNSTISCVDEKISFTTLCEKIHSNINYMLDSPYPNNLEKEFEFHRMVAL